MGLDTEEEQKAVRRPRRQVPVVAPLGPQKSDSATGGIKRDKLRNAEFAVDRLSRMMFLCQ